VGRARAGIEVEARAGAAEALWYDVTRRPSFIDGFKTVAKLDGDWPRAGARLVWDSVPAGRGRVVETVTRYEVRSGQTVQVEDERITGEQTVTFTPLGEGRSRIDLELVWRHKEATPLTPLLDLLFVRRQFADELRRSLARFRREVEVEAELSGALY